MPQYAMPFNVILFLAGFWTAVIYGFATRDWLGALLWLTVGFVALTSERLTPARAEDDDARSRSRSRGAYFGAAGTRTASMTCTHPFDARTEATTFASPMYAAPSRRVNFSFVPSTIPTICPSSK